MITFYNIVKALHVIFVIAWMAGMLYLPRLFVYHAAAEPGSPQSETFKVMERRLMRGIINPSMILVWIFGLTLAFLGHWWLAGWFHWKFALVLLMTAVHGALSRWRRAFERDENSHSERFYRIANEVPAVILVLIVFLVVLKPTL